MTRFDVVVIGAGQAGLAVGYYLRRTGLSHVLLDASPVPGGAWPDTWRSLRLFSPADASSLPGWLMPPAADGYPTRDEAVDYLTRYEHRYEPHSCPWRRGLPLPASVNSFTQFGQRNVESPSDLGHGRPRRVRFAALNPGVRGDGEACAVGDRLLREVAAFAQVTNHARKSRIGRGRAGHRWHAASSRALTQERKSRTARGVQAEAAYRRLTRRLTRAWTRLPLWRRAPAEGFAAFVLVHRRLRRDRGRRPQRRLARRPTA